MREPGRHKVWASKTITWDTYLHNWPRKSHQQSTGQTTMKYIWQVTLILGAAPKISLCHFTAQRSQTLPPSTGMVICFVGIKLVGTIATLSLNPKTTLDILRQVDLCGVFAASSDAQQCHVLHVPVKHRGPGWVVHRNRYPRLCSVCRKLLNSEIIDYEDKSSAFGRFIFF